MKMEAVREFEREARRCGPLETELRAQGVPVIPSSLVRAHRRRTRVHLGYQLVRLGLWLPQLYFIPRLFEHYKGHRLIAAWVYGLGVLGLGITGTCIGNTWGWSTLCYLLVTPLAANLLAGFLFFRYSLDDIHGRRVWDWRQIRLDYVLDHRERHAILWPPEHLLERAHHAARSSATVLVEYSLTDPFLVAVRGLERVYIGAWETGDERLDAF